MNTFRILCVNEYMRKGGGEYYFLQLVNGLSAKGCEVVGLSGRGDMERLAGKNIRFYGPDIRSRIATLVELLRNEQFDVLHANSFRELIPLVIAKQLSSSKCPVIYTKHNLNKLERCAFSRRLYGIFLRHFVKKTVVLSQKEGRHLVRDCYVPADKVAVIYNGVERGEKSLCGCNDRKWDVCFVGRMAPEKDPYLFLDVVRALDSMISNLKVVVAGDGDMLESVKTYAKTLGVIDRIDFLGWVDDVPEICSNSKILILTSKREQMPISVLQSMSAGTPVVSVDVGAIDEVVVHGINGFMVEHRSSEAIACRVLEILSDGGLWRDLSTNAKRIFEETFSLDSMLKEFILVCNSLIAS